jgi:hypothetical protein
MTIGSWLKAKALILSVGATWLFFILVMLPLIGPVTVLAIWFKQLRPYRYRLWIGQDQLVNVIHNGDPDHTISGRVGHMSLQGSKTAAVMERIIDWMFYVAIKQEQHCRKSIEWDIIKRPKREFK